MAFEKIRKGLAKMVKDIIKNDDVKKSLIKTTSTIEMVAKDKLLETYQVDNNALRKDEELIVCRDVAEIYCNTINFINELCTINSHMIEALNKFMSAVSINQHIETHKLSALEDEIDFRMKEIDGLTKIIPSLKFNVTPSGKSVLAKHNLSEMEVSSTETCVKQSINDILSNFLYLKKSINGNKYDFVSVYFALARLKSFQCESNALYYGALEGLCSFPIESLNFYYEVSPHWHNLPNNITLRSMNKEGFKMSQEMEFKKAHECLNTAKEYIDNYSNTIDTIITTINRRDVNLFIAGSKSLQQERDVFAGVVNILQSKWKSRGIDVYSYSYQNFPHEVADMPHQEQYNNFIAKHVNVAVFILNGKAGEYTKEEFDVAYRCFKKNGMPKIFVYSLRDESNTSDSYIHKLMQEEKQYWIEFKDVDELRHLLNIDIESYLLEAYTKMVNTAI